MDGNRSVAGQRLGGAGAVRRRATGWRSGAGPEALFDEGFRHELEQAGLDAAVAALYEYPGPWWRCVATDDDRRLEVEGGVLSPDPGSGQSIGRVVLSGFEGVGDGVLDDVGDVMVGDGVDRFAA